MSNTVNKLLSFQVCNTANTSLPYHVSSTANKLLSLHMCITVNKLLSFHMRSTVNTLLSLHMCITANMLLSYHASEMVAVFQMITFDRVYIILLNLDRTLCTVAPQLNEKLYTKIYSISIPVFDHILR